MRRATAGSRAGRVNPAMGVPSTLYGVASSFPTDAWQVGDSSGLAFIGRWNGDYWAVFPSPAIAGRLHAADVIAPGDAWLTGDRFQVLYHFTMGGPVDDPRLQSHPPYQHLSHVDFHDLRAQTEQPSRW